MQTFSLCDEARRYGATFPHSKMISPSPICFALLSARGEVLKIQLYLDKVKETVVMVVSINNIGQ